MKIKLDCYATKNALRIMREKEWTAIQSVLMDGKTKGSFAEEKNTGEVQDLLGSLEIS